MVLSRVCLRLYPVMPAANHSQSPKLNMSFALLSLILASPVYAATTPRAQVKRLPGWAGDTPTRHFSGMVESEPETGTHNFYYLVESQSDAENSELFVWMNGGPYVPCLFPTLYFRCCPLFSAIV